MSDYAASSLSAGYPYRLPYSRGANRTPLRPLRAVVRTLTVWQDRLVERAALRNMPGHLLRDMGSDVAWARREADKPFWRA